MYKDVTFRIVYNSKSEDILYICWVGEGFNKCGVSKLWNIGQQLKKSRRPISTYKESVRYIIIKKIGRMGIE